MIIGIISLSHEFLVHVLLSYIILYDSGIIRYDLLSRSLH